MEKLKKAGSNLDEYLKEKKVYNDVPAIIMKTNSKEISILKGIVDELINKIGNGIVFIANTNGDNVNFICRSNCKINAGLTVKEASSLSEGNGGGSNTFAQGGGKTTKHINEIFESIINELNPER